MSDWKHVDPLGLIVKRNMIGLPGQPVSNSGDVEAIANAMDNNHEAIDGDFDIPEEHKSNLSNFRRSGMPPAKMIQPGDEAEMMMQQYMSQNGGYIVPDGMSALEFQKKMNGDKNGDNLLLGEVDKDDDGVICG
jgi:hypothetical protein